MKKLARKIVASILGYQVRRLYKKKNFKVIGVAGSIGKTSTKLAIANVLKAKYRVQYQEGNYNDLVTVPLVFFGESLPSLFNPLSWLRLFWRNQIKTYKDYPYDVVVVELGSDGPGQIEEFASYLKLEIGVLTAITPEHMQFFENLDEVAKEELAISDFSSLVLASKDFCDDKYLSGNPNLLTYAIRKAANYMLSLNGTNLAVNSGKEVILENEANSLSQPELYSILAASAVGYKLGMQTQEIKEGVKNIRPVPGRMQRLQGINNSTILDDSYNSSPEAVKLALETLYKMPAPQKIAVLGNMNELGNYSVEAHREVGGFCDSKQLNLVVTIGQDANEYLAKAAEANSCKVERFDSPYKIGEYLKPLVKEGAVILVKGSQNGVFAEEAIKSLLANPADVTKLVRQNSYWLDLKKKAFNR